MRESLISTPGFYGKVPTHGDFVSRRLPPEFIVPWDAWVQRWIMQGQTVFREAWPSVYWGSPVVKFVVEPQACGESTWVGVLIPSADRVGRLFPLSIAAAVQDGGLEKQISCVSKWHALMVELTHGAMDGNFSLKLFDERLKQSAVLFNKHGLE